MQRCRKIITSWLVTGNSYKNSIVDYFLTTAHLKNCIIPYLLQREPEVDLISFRVCVDSSARRCGVCVCGRSGLFTPGCGLRSLRSVPARSVPVSRVTPTCEDAMCIKAT